ncbi:MAG TPA: CcmD family protein [Ohtaekwangia sp.]
MKSVKNFFFVVVVLLLTFPAQAQNEVEMADTMRSEGKIYVVVGIILIILLGLIAYLFALDRKVKKLEDRLSGKH